MTITPRTCLWPLTGALIISFTCSIGLTYRSNTHCFAAVCSERHSPQHTRIQVVVWYMWLALTVTVLGFRSFKPWARKILNQQIKLVGKHRVSLSSILMVVWTLGLYGAITSIWWNELEHWYISRAPGMQQAAGLLATISLTGQWSAMSLGLSLTPVSRHSALGSFFKLTYKGIQGFHKSVSCLFICLVLLHALLYIYWAGYWKTWPAGKQALFPIYNPTYNADEVYPGNTTTLGRYRASLVFTGGTSAVIMLFICITSIRIVREKWFKLFYWAHTLVLLSIIIIALHASTLFYCIAPGIFMWFLDKLMRIYELYGALYGTITPLGKGWYQLSTPLPRTRLEGCACSSPVAKFYIYHADSAVRELHPFTTTTHLALQDAITDPTENSITIEFLFRRHGGATPFVSVTSSGEGSRGKWLRWVHRYRKPSNPDHDLGSPIDSTVDRAEWRARQQVSFNLFELEPPFDPRESETLAASASREGSLDVEALAPVRKKNKAELLMDNASVPISIRLEGPFFTPANPSQYHTVVCIVEGAGVSGALAIACAFQHLESFEQRMLVPTGSNYDMSAVSAGISEEGVGRNKLERKWKRCLIVWVVQEEDFIHLPGLAVPEGSMMEVRVHFTGKGRKACCYYQTLDGVLNKDVGAAAGRRTVDVDERVSLWCYAAGSKTFVGKVEEACKARQGQGVEWTVAEIAV